jgi:hypothetical protein
VNAGLERFRVEKTSVIAGRLDLVGGSLAPDSRTDSRAREYADCVRTLREDPIPGRIYASPEGPVAEAELPFHTLLPLLSGRMDVINGFFAGEAGGASWILNNVYRKQLGSSPALLRMLGVRYVLAGTDQEGRLGRGLAGAAQVAFRSSYWVLFRLAEGRLGWSPCAQAPIMVAADDRGWQELCTLWFARAAEDPEGRRVPFLVRWRSDADPGIEQGCSGLVVLSWEERGRRKIEPLVARFRDRRLPILTVEGGRALPDAETIVPEAWDPASVPQPDQQSDRRPDDADRTPLDTNLQLASEQIGSRPAWTHRARVSCTRPTFFRFPVSYYRGWKAAIDGQRTDLVQMSPGIAAVYVPGGTHAIELRYGGARGARVGQILSIVGLLCAAALGRTRNASAVRSSKARSHSRGLWIARVLILLLPVWLTQRAIGERLIGLPTPVAPEAGVHVPSTDLHLRWHPDPRVPVGKSHAYTVELDRKFPEGWRLAHRWSRYTPIQIDLATGLVPGSSYRWRVRTERGLERGRWSRWRTFYAPATDPLGRTWQTSDPFYVDLVAAPTAVDSIRIRGSTNLPPRTVLDVRLRMVSGAVYEGGSVEVLPGRADLRLRTPGPIQSVEASVDLFRQGYPADMLLRNPERLRRTAEAGRARVESAWLAERHVDPSPQAEPTPKLREPQPQAGDPVPDHPPPDAGTPPTGSASPTISSDPLPGAGTPLPSKPFGIDRAFRVGSDVWAFGRAGTSDGATIEVGIWRPAERSPVATRQVSTSSGYWNCQLHVPRLDEPVDDDLVCRAVFRPAVEGLVAEPLGEEAGVGRLVPARLIFSSRGVGAP